MSILLNWPVLIVITTRGTNYLPKPFVIYAIKAMSFLHNWCFLLPLPFPLFTFFFLAWIFYTKGTDITVSHEVLLEIWPKFYKWYQKLPSYVCIITQKYYQSEACTLRELAIFVSRVGRVDSRNFHLSSTVIPTFYEFFAPKPPCRGYAPAIMHIFGLSILLENFWYQSEPRRILGRVILARKFKPLFCRFTAFT